MRFPRCTVVLLLAGIAFFAGEPLHAGEPGFRRFAETVSPNGAYVLAWGWSKDSDLSKIKEWPEDKDNDEGQIENYLVDAVHGKVLGVIPGFEYFRGTPGRQNHGSIEVGWSPDSKEALAIYGSKWSSSAIVWIRPAAKSFIEVQESMEKHYLRLLQTKEKRRDPGGMTFESPAVLSGSTLAVYAWAQIPKEEPVFLYRLRYKVKVEGGKAQFEIIGSRKLSDENPEPGDEEALNKVYGQLRATLSEAEKAALKTEEVAWLKQREALEDDLEQQAFTRLRVSYLRARLGK